VDSIVLQHPKKSVINNADSRAFSGGPIRIAIINASKHAKIGIDATRGLNILREG